MSALDLTDDEVARLRKGELVQLRRPLDPQPPTIEAVKKRTGAGFSVYQWRPGKWDIGGPVGVVRDMMGRRPQWECPLATVGSAMAVQGSAERCRVVAVTAGETDGVWLWTTTVETTTPTEPGWYWYRWTAEPCRGVRNHEPQPVLVLSRAAGRLWGELVDSLGLVSVDALTSLGEWLGEAKPPGMRVKPSAPADGGAR